MVQTDTPVGASVMRKLLVFIFLFCVRVGNGYSEIDAISYLKSEVEISLDLSFFFKNRNSITALSYLHFLSEINNLENLNDMSSEAHCGNFSTISDVFTDFSSEMWNITQPLNFWITEATKQIEKLKIHSERLKKIGKIRILFPVDSKNRPSLDSFLSDCNILNKHQANDINSNDIYSYWETSNNGNVDIFQCGSGEFLNFESTCDGNIDCWDGSDELGLCHDSSGCEECEGVCVLGPRGPYCSPTCPTAFNYSFKVCKNHQKCYHVCSRGEKVTPIATKCLIQILPNLMDTILERSEILRNITYQNYIKALNETYNCKNKNLVSISTTIQPTWSPTTRHPTWHPTSSHPTWHSTTRHPTWHPTTRHPTWHPTTRHPTWHPTSSHPTWHPTTRHPTWDPTSSHPTWHPTTRHPTWDPTTRHPTWHPTTRHPTWHPTSSHPTWHTTTRHPTWHPTTRHPTWHTTTRHPTWHPTWYTSTSPTELKQSDEYDYDHHTTKHKPHSTTSHTTHHTTKHTTPHTTSPSTTHPPTTSPSTTHPPNTSPSLGYWFRVINNSGV